MSHRLRQRVRATYGHHGTSLGSSRDREPETVSYMQERKERKKRKPNFGKTSGKRKEMDPKREAKGPKHQRQKHADPGEAPKRRPELGKDWKMATATHRSGDLDDWGGGIRDRYRASSSPLPPESEESRRRREAEYGLDRYAQPSGGARAREAGDCKEAGNL